MVRTLYPANTENEVSDGVFQQPANAIFLEPFGGRDGKTDMLQ